MQRKKCLRMHERYAFNVAMSDPIENLRNSGFTPARLAGLMSNITPQAISQWKQVPVERVIEVERVTGISRHILRPDLSAIFVKRIVLPAAGEPEGEETAA